MTALIIAVVVIVAVSIFADYKWRRWMAARRLERGREDDQRRS